GHDVATVGCHIEAYITRSRRRSALQQGTQRTGVPHPLVKAQIIQEKDERPLRSAQEREKSGQARKFLYRALQQGHVLPFLLKPADDGRNCRRFARSSRTP